MIRRFILFLASIAFSLYAGTNAYAVASAGVTHGIPQLEGDGGGGIVVAVLSLFAGGAGFLSRWISVSLFAIAMIIAVLTGVAFQDPVTGLWAIAPFVLGTLTWLQKGKRTRVATRWPTNRHPSGRTPKDAM